jgi:DNA-3-methyladenine glycosylase II
MTGPLTESFRKARRHLARRDAVLKALMTAVGPCTLQPHPDPLRVLTRSIVSQMISTKAAAAINARLEASMPGGVLSADGLLALGEDDLRGVGLSRAKALALSELAELAQSGELPLERLAEMSDEEVIARLVPLRGIGVWTAEMFLIFCLGRLDVLPVGDLGLRAGVQDCYGLAGLPGVKELRQLGEAWRPYRSVATWYFWRSRGGVPQSR